MKILVAEDDADMQKIVCLYLNRGGFDTESACDGKTAFDMLCENKYDLLIADWMMPGMNGIELCEAVRSCSIQVKIIMLTARGTAENEITGLSCGADDYIRKPFEPQVLLLRVRKLLGQEEIIRCGDLLMNLRSRIVTKAGAEIRLTQTEFSLLKILMGGKGITQTREQLLERVWGAEYDGDERTLDTHVRRLRNKIGKDSIRTYVGIGYRLEGNE